MTLLALPPILLSSSRLNAQLKQALSYFFPFSSLTRLMVVVLAPLHLVEEHI